MSGLSPLLGRFALTQYMGTIDGITLEIQSSSISSISMVTPSLSSIYCYFNPFKTHIAGYTVDWHITNFLLGPIQKGSQDKRDMGRVTNFLLGPIQKGSQDKKPEGYRKSQRQCEGRYGTQDNSNRRAFDSDHSQLDLLAPRSALLLWNRKPAWVHRSWPRGHTESTLPSCEFILAGLNPSVPPMLGRPIHHHEWEQERCYSGPSKTSWISWTTAAFQWTKTFRRSFHCSLRVSNASNSTCRTNIKDLN
jgi:hypothetical protein